MKKERNVIIFFSLTFIVFLILIPVMHERQSYAVQSRNDIENTTQFNPAKAAPVTALQKFPATSSSSVVAVNNTQNPDTAPGLVYVSWNAVPADNGGPYVYTVTASPAYRGSTEVTTKTGLNMGCSMSCYNGGGDFPTNGPYTFTVTATNEFGTVTVGTSNPETVTGTSSNPSL